MGFCQSPIWPCHFDFNIPLQIDDNPPRKTSTGVALYGDWVQEVQENRRCPKTAQFARDYKKKDWQKIQEGISSFLP